MPLCFLRALCYGPTKTLSELFFIVSLFHSFSCSLSLPLSLFVLSFLLVCHEMQDVAPPDHCLLKTFCVNCSNDGQFSFFFCFSPAFTSWSDAGRQILTQSQQTPRVILHSHMHMHENMHMLSMHLQIPPLRLLGAELCHLFKCSLIVWPWGSLKTHIL